MRAVLVPLEIDPTPPPAGSRPQRLSGSSMGTDWSARLLSPPGLAADLDLALKRELDLVVTQMSHWEPDSLLSRYNAAPAGSWHPLPPAFYEVMACALAVSEATGGACDPAAGELVNLWGFGPLRRYDQSGFYAPDAQAVAQALARRAQARVEIDHEGRRLLQPGGAILDLSAIAKGHAVDRLARCLERHGVHHYLVEIGGELRGAGLKADGQPWWVEIEGVPDTDGGQRPVVALHGLAVATSGDYRRYFHQAGRRRPHTLDPRTGYPIDNQLASVTVLAPSCMQADALSTGLTVLGPQAGLAFAEARGLAARFLLRRDGTLTELTSPAWRALLQ